jgi:hypothetical protein
MTSTYQTDRADEFQERLGCAVNRRGCVSTVVCRHISASKSEVLGRIKRIRFGDAKRTSQITSR